MALRLALTDRDIPYVVAVRAAVSAQPGHATPVQPPRSGARGCPPAPAYPDPPASKNSPWPPGIPPAWSAGLSVSGDGTGVVAHAGGAGLRLLADRTGLTGEISTALARRSFAPRHDRGQVLTDVAVMLADGGEAIADIDVLRHQSPLLGSVASAPTVWRTLAGLSRARLARIFRGLCPVPACR